MATTRIPMLFIRLYGCTNENGLISNTSRRTLEAPSLPARLSYVVMNPSANSWKFYDSRWMSDERVITDHTTGHSILVHDVDIVDDEDVFIFDLDDPIEAYRQALMKMQELWAQIILPEPEPVHEHEDDMPGADYLRESFVHDDELPAPDTTSEHYQKGVSDAANGDGYSQYYAGFIDEGTGEHVRPAGRRESFEYHMGFKSRQ